MREAELLRPLLLEEIDIASEPEDEKILELPGAETTKEELERLRRKMERERQTHRKSDG